MADPEAATRFYADAFGLDEGLLRLRAAADPSEGFRGFTLALTVHAPAAGAFTDPDGFRWAAADAPTAA
ncbi:hypothetical protein HUT16_02325 [Kitasatospora sp. NA04385]|nr:hypothetical protein HUT16_02325 [Kitasatospora sp. NA04385]